MSETASNSKQRSRPRAGITGGMLERVINPQHGKIRFGYDPLGRRIYKEVKNVRTHWFWNGNVPLHEWQTRKEEPKIDIVTRVFEEGSFVPYARIADKQSCSIVTDYLGTPTQMYDTDGNKTREATLDIYGWVRTFEGRSRFPDHSRQVCYVTP